MRRPLPDLDVSMILITGDDRHVYVKVAIYRRCRRCGLEAHTVADLGKFVQRRRRGYRFNTENLCKKCKAAEVRARRKLKSAIRKRAQRIVNDANGSRSLAIALAYADHIVRT